MNVLRRIVKNIRSFESRKPKTTSRIEFKRPLCYSFFVEAIHTDGRSYGIRVDAKNIVRKDGENYLYAWCHMCPFFCSIPIERIRLLFDDDTGEIVTQEDVEGWLIDRALN